MNTKEKGDLSVVKCIAYFVENGYEVLLPIGDRKKYDLVVDDGKTLQKVQCKYSAAKQESGSFEIHLAVCGGNSGRVLYKYQEEDFDILFIYTSDKDMYSIPMSNIGPNRATITVGKKYCEFKIK